MERQTCFREGTAKQCKAVVGLPVLVFVFLLVTLELSLPWAISLNIGQFVGLSVATFCAISCIRSQHKSHYAGEAGLGKLCTLCEQPQLPDCHHCEVCEKCVAGFSHHSEWLDTCIGSANLSLYLLGTVSLGVMACTQVTAGVAVLVLMMTDREVMLEINEKYSLEDGGYFFHLVLYFAIFISIAIALECGVNFCLQLRRFVLLWKTRRQTQPVIFYANVTHSQEAGPFKEADPHSLTQMKD